MKYWPNRSRSLILQRLPLTARRAIDIRRLLRSIVGHWDAITQIKCPPGSSYCWVELQTPELASDVLDSFLADRDVLQGAYLRRPVEFRSPAGQQEDPDSVLPTTPEFEKRYREFFEILSPNWQSEALPYKCIV
jgi:hypothetical protein